MIIPGSDCKKNSSSEEIAKRTLDCLKKNVPSKVPGIAFLSGGQSEIEASKNLNEIMKIYPDAFAKIKIENEASLRLFESCGFKKKYYILEKE